MCSYYCGGALMENLSSFPLCHSSGPPKGLKQRARRGRVEGHRDGNTLPGERRLRKRFKAILIYFFRQFHGGFFVQVKKVESGEEREPVEKKKKKKRCTRSQLSNCGCVQSYKCLHSYLCYLYACMRLRADTHSDTHLSVDTPALHSRSCAPRSTSSGKTELLYASGKKNVVQHVGGIDL